MVGISPFAISINVLICTHLTYTHSSGLHFTCPHFIASIIALSGDWWIIIMIIYLGVGKCNRICCQECNQQATALLSASDTLCWPSSRAMLHIYIICFFHQMLITHRSCGSPLFRRLLNRNNVCEWSRGYHGHGYICCVWSLAIEVSLYKMYSFGIVVSLMHDRNDRFEWNYFE